MGGGTGGRIEKGQLMGERGLQRQQDGYTATEKQPGSVHRGTTCPLCGLPEGTVLGLTALYSNRCV